MSWYQYSSAIDEIVLPSLCFQEVLAIISPVLGVAIQSIASFPFYHTRRLCKKFKVDKAGTSF
jgi:hypothetical protein